MSEPRNQRIDHQPCFMLSATPWRESSLRLEVFSRDYGRVLLLARSARKRQSELRGVLVPFVPLKLSWYGTQEWKTLHRAEWVGGWAQPQGMALLGGLYVNELVCRLTAREDPNRDIYAALNDIMQALAKSAHYIPALRQFEWRLLNALGLASDLRRDVHGNAVQAERLYHMLPESLPVPWQGGTPSHGIVVGGSTLLGLSEAIADHATALQEARQLTRLWLDHYLPEGTHARRVLNQLQYRVRALQAAHTTEQTAPTASRMAV